MRARSVAPLLLIMTLALDGCGGDDPLGPELPSLTGSMSARVDGQPWSAAIATASVTGDILAFAGSDANNVTIGMALLLAGPGTYSVGPTFPTNATYSEGGTGQWAAGPSRGSGSITLATFTNDRATGTFTLMLEPDAGNSETSDRSITQGRFDVTF